MPSHFIGLMSGTSLDGVDGVLADFDGATRVLAHAYRPFPDALRAELLALNQSGPDELHRAALAANALVRLYAQVVQELLQTSGVPASGIRAIGAHGQTVRHRPGLFDGTGYTLQINNPALLAELTGITVVADFRSRDVAAGGQGAPLVPVFHHAVFGRPDTAVAVLNIGGISNLSVLADKGVLGFDCGPGNALLDHWCRQHTGQAYDAAGQWAASGRVDEALLRDLLQEPYFDQPPPKSTGRDLFHAEWLARHLAPYAAVSAVDVQTTLTELTAQICAADLRRYGPGCRQLHVCGGGALNHELMRRLQAKLPDVKVDNSQAAGLPPLQVEAAAFAWLASRTLAGETGSLESVTGARGARVLGAIYPA
jgi:anhydro-N-acetylmuramic acid kinase